LPVAPSVSLGLAPGVPLLENREEPVVTLPFGVVLPVPAAPDMPMLLA